MVAWCLQRCEAGDGEVGVRDRACEGVVGQASAERQDSREHPPGPRSTHNLTSGDHPTGPRSQASGHGGTAEPRQAQQAAAAVGSAGEGLSSRASSAAWQAPPGSRGPPDVHQEMESPPALGPKE